MIDSKNILQQFNATYLKDMEGVKLMNRTDTKFAFSFLKYEQLLEELKPFYNVLQIEDKRICRYKTLYYDTKNLGLYIKHHNGELNRYKIRHRTYLDSNVGFLEVKFKNNKGRTIKDRILSKDVPLTWENDALSFLNALLPFEPISLIPAIWVNYSRITLVSKVSAERLTIDLDLEFVKEGLTKKLSNLVIAEVKQEKRSPSSFMTVMKKYHIREGSISKYCMGIALTCNEVKRNNFKQKLLTLNHIVHDDFVTSSR